MRRTFFIKILPGFILLLVIISFLNLQENGIFQIIIAQKDISLTKDWSLQNNQTELAIYNQNIIVQLLADRLEIKLNKSAAILEIASKLPQIMSLPDANLIDPSIHGISEYEEISKRQVAQNILSVDKDFGRIFYMLPNGDMYFEEPYFLQENLTLDNFAFRDYYKGAVSTGDTYLGDVVLSSSSGLPQFNIVVPLYSNNSGSSENNTTKNLIGLLTGIQDTSIFKNSLESLPLSENEIAMYVDSNGNTIASSSSSTNLDNQNQSNKISSLQSFKDVIDGKSGYNIENINDHHMLIVYAPVKFKTTTWGVFFISFLNNTVR